MTLDSPDEMISGHMKADGKVRAACSLCQNLCGAIAYVSNGRVTRLEGDPDNPRNRGHLCAKGLSGFLTLYSSGRVTQPLMRTNPAKGLGVDPGWKAIPWDQAIDIVAGKLKTAREHSLHDYRNPSEGATRRKSQRIIYDTFDHWASRAGVEKSWANALGAFECTLSATCYCGNAVHPPSYLNTASFEVTVDAEYSKYVLLIGAQAGSIIHYDTMNVARHIAEGRPGGIKVVVVDPMAGYAGSKAEEWVPIRPGTDTAFILGLLNLLLNRHGIYDSDFIKQKTNGPYLIGDGGLYVRDPSTKKPLVWDPIDGRAKAFDDPSTKDYSLEGDYTVAGIRCRPAFQLVKEHVKTYTPEMVAEVTTVPAGTLVRIAKELGEAACIGQTITIGGKELPYRPVSVVWYRGLSAHRHSFLAGLAALMLPTVLGAIQVPGGLQGHPPAPESVSPDGLLAITATQRPGSQGAPYPARSVSKPSRADAFELFPVSVYSQQILPVVMDNPARFGIDPKEFVWPEVMIMCRDNPINNAYSPADVVRGLSRIPFVVSFDVDLDETANSLVDIVFPDLHHLEKLGDSLFLRVGEPGYWYGAKPVVHPPFEKPWDRIVSIAEVLLEIARRAGFFGDVVRTLNEDWKLKGTPYELDQSRNYSYGEIIDNRLKAWLGPTKGLEWLMSDEGGLSVWPAKPEEKYKGAFRKARLHLYFEFMIGAGKDVERTVKGLDLPWWDTTDYVPVPDWKPCPSYSKRNPLHNLFLINYKIPVMAHAVGRRNPLPMQLIERRMHLDMLLIHPETAALLGIGEGDAVEVEDTRGRKQKSVAHLTERVHPEVVASSQHRLKKGVRFNEFATMEDDAFDFVGGAIDSCILVSVKKAIP